MEEKLGRACPGCAANSTLRISLAVLHVHPTHAAHGWWCSDRSDSMAGMCTVVIDKRETGDGACGQEGVSVAAGLGKSSGRKTSQTNSEETRVANNEASPSRKPSRGHSSDGDANNADHVENSNGVKHVNNGSRAENDEARVQVIAEVGRVVATLRGIIDKVSNLDGDGWFQRPVTEKDAPNYFAVIKNPMCFDTIRTKIESLQYVSWQEIVRDFELMFNNAMLYNQKRSRVHKQALVILRAGMKQLLDCEIDGRSALERLGLLKKSNSNLQEICGIEPVKFDVTAPEDVLVGSEAGSLPQLKTREPLDTAEDEQPCESGYSSYDDGECDMGAARSRLVDDSPVEVVVREPRIAASASMPPPRDRAALSLTSSNAEDAEAQRRLLWQAQWLRLRVRELERQKAGYQDLSKILEGGSDDQTTAKKLARKTIPGFDGENLAEGVAFFRAFVPSGDLCCGTSKATQRGKGSESVDVVIDEDVYHQPPGLDMPAVDAKARTQKAGSSMVLSENYPAVCHASLTILEAKLRDTRDAVMAMRHPAMAASVGTARGRGRGGRSVRAGRRTLSRASALSFPLNADETSALRQMSIRKRKQSREAFGLHDMVVPSGAMGSPKFVERVQVRMIDTPPVRVLDEEELRRRQEVIAAYQKGLVGSNSKSSSGTDHHSKTGARNVRVNRKAEREDAAAMRETAVLAAANVAKELLGDEGSSEEDISDEAYEARHKKQEEEERVRYNAFLETMTSANGGRKTVGDGRGRSMMGMQTSGMPKEKPSSSRKRSASRTSSELSGADLKTPATGLRKTRR